MTGWGEESGNPMSKLSLTSKYFWVTLGYYILLKLLPCSLSLSLCRAWLLAVSQRRPLNMPCCLGLFLYVGPSCPRQVIFDCFDAWDSSTQPLKASSSCLFLSAQTGLNYSWQHTEMFRECRAVWHNPTRSNKAQLTLFNLKENLRNASEMLPWGTSTHCANTRAHTHTRRLFLQVSNLAISTGCTCGNLFWFGNMEAGIIHNNVQEHFFFGRTWKDWKVSHDSKDSNYGHLATSSGMLNNLCPDMRSLIVFKSRFFVEYQS